MTITARVNPTDHDILDVLQDRWSPRAYEPSAIDEAKLSKSLEAARWSPSAYNNQPWQFIVGRRGDTTFDRIASVLVEFNQAWATNASVLILTVAELASEDGREFPTAVYDLGQSVAHLTIQAHSDGLIVHQMSGFDKLAAKSTFALPDRLEPMTVVALGTLGDAALLPDDLRAGETRPRERKPLAHILYGD